MNKRFWYLLFTSSSVFLIVLIYCFSFGSQYNVNLSDKTPAQIKNNIILVDNDTNKEKKITLPYHLKSNKSGNFTLKVMIDNKYINGDSSFTFMSEDMDIKASMNNFSVYSYIKNENMNFSNTTGRNLNIIKLPNKNHGNELEINIHTLLGDKTEYTISPINVGEKSAIIMQIFKEQLPFFVLLVINIIFAIVGIIVSIIFGKNLRDENIEEIVHMCLFSIMGTMYFLVEYEIAWFIISNSYLRYFIKYMCVMLMPMPLFSLLKLHSLKKYGKMLSTLSLITFTNFIIQTILNFSKISDYKLMENFTNIISCCSCLVILFIMFSNLYNKHEEDFWFVMTICPVIIGIFIDLINYKISSQYNNAVFFQVGVIIFILVQVINIIFHYFDYYKLAIRAKTYAKMAYYDNMTNIKNRFAYESDIKEIQEKNNDYISLWCAEVDINNLKYINDTMGHPKGDELIISVAQVINMAFSEFGICYRVGGDEFIILMQDKQEKDVIERINYVKSLIDEYNLKREDFEISIAIGYDSYKIAQNDSINDLVSRVDKLMYKNKEKIKNSENYNYSNKP